MYSQCRIFNKRKVKINKKNKSHDKSPNQTIDLDRSTFFFFFFSPFWIPTQRTIFPSDSRDSLFLSPPPTLFFSSFPSPLHSSPSRLLSSIPHTCLHRSQSSPDRHLQIFSRLRAALCILLSPCGLAQPGADQPCPLALSLLAHNSGLSRSSI